jgi:hypothetical protein
LKKEERREKKEEVRRKKEERRRKKEERRRKKNKICGFILDFSIFYLLFSFFPPSLHDEFRDWAKTGQEYTGM